MFGQPEPPEPVCQHDGGAKRIRGCATGEAKSILVESMEWNVKSLIPVAAKFVRNQDLNEEWMSWGMGGGLHSTEVAYLLFTKLLWLTLIVLFPLTTLTEESCYELLSELFTKSSVSFFYCSLRWIHLLCVLLYFIGYSLFRVPSDHSPIPNSLLLHQLCFLIFSGQPDRQVAQHGRR